MPKLTIESSNKNLVKVLELLEDLENGHTVSAPTEKAQKTEDIADTQDKPESNSNRRTNKKSKVNTDKQAKEEPTATDTKVEPKTEEPKTEEPKTEDPKTEDPKTEDPKTEDPVEVEVIPPEEQGEVTLASLAVMMKKIAAKNDKTVVAELFAMIKPYGGLQGVPQEKWQELHDWAVKHIA